MISQCMQNKEIVLIFCNPEDTESFSAGYIDALSSNEVLMTHIDAFGKKDGLVVKPLSYIFKLEYGGKYSKKIGILDQINGNMHKNEKLDLSLNSLFETILNYACSNKKNSDNRGTREQKR